jgi:ketosteroid isomerase-like protein
VKGKVVTKVSFVQIDLQNSKNMHTIDDSRKDSAIKANLAIVEAHFHNESLNEVEKACDLYTDDIVWEAPARNILLRNKQDVIENYRKMFASVKNVEFRTLQRFGTEDRVVDDSIVRFKLIGSNSVPAPIGSQIEMRLVHIFEMREAKIARETAFEMWKVVQG